MEYRLLGPVEVLADGRQLPVGGPKQRTLLAVLLIHANRVVAVESLIDALWGQEPPATSVSQVQSLVAGLRRVLGRERVVTRAPGYLVRVEPGELDVEVFEQQVAAARQQLAAGRVEVAAAGLRAALGLWRGRALGGAVSPVVEAEGVRLEERRLAVVEERVEAELALGRHGDLVGELRGLVVEEPLRERLRGQLMVALYRSSRQAEALEVYRQGRQVLAEELGLEPGVALRQLERAVLTADPGLDVAPPTARPAQLPAAAADFTGREAHVEVLCRRLSGGRDDPVAPPAVAVSVIAGRAGVGKTALAVHVAQRLRERFPDGQLFADLGGAGGRPAAPGEVLDWFLRSLGVAPAAIPAGVEERAGSYRDRLADRRVLVVLDNAADERQVRPLLPGSSSCAVLVTSRIRLAGLEGVHLVDLDVLAPGPAVELLGRIVGPDRVAAEPAAAGQIVELCGQLPLAVRIIAARLRSRPSWPLTAMVERLADERRRLDELAAGELAVRSSFLLSYRALGPAEQRMFRLLGLLEGPDIATGAAAALAGRSEAAADAALERLVDVQLLEAPSAGRYRFHDLVGLFARERAAVEEGSSARQAALARVFEWYVARAEQAGELFEPGSLRNTSGNGSAQAFADRQAADLWLQAERANLVVLAQRAARDRSDSVASVAWRLSNALWRFLHLHWYWSDWQTLSEAAIQAAERCGNPAAAARAVNDLGIIHCERGHHERAVAYFREGLELYQRTGDQRGQAGALNNIGDAYRHQSRTREAITYLQQALEIVRQIGSSEIECRILDTLGNVFRDQGRLRESADCLMQSLTLSRKVNDRWAEIVALISLGGVYRQQGRLQESVGTLQQSLRRSREAGARFEEAMALQELGLSVDALEGRQAARMHWMAAHAALDELGAPHADAVRALLNNRVSVD